MEKPITTLFMLSSLDWKISTWVTDKFDVDKDFPKIKWVKEWLYQYYDLEQNTSLFSLNSWKVLEKIWINKPQILAKTVVSFLVIDNKPHLTRTWIKNLLIKSKKLFIITTNPKHPAFEWLWEPNLEIIYYKDEINFEELFEKLKKEYKIKELTIQTWGTLNSVFLRKNLIDKVWVVIAPVLIWWKKTSTLIDWNSIDNMKNLTDIKALKLMKVDKMKYSYISLKYNVIKK
jgi:2,5-diamino-6-(ribosylamino)-4(3H)-pyrimidinone 5'-phosphate reductase